MNLAIVQKYQHLKKQVGNRVLFTLLLTTLMIIATMFITDSWLNDITDSNKQAKADYLKMSRVSQIRTQIERAESAQRGYLLSQDERYLPIYTDSKGNVLTQLQQLSTLLNTSNTDPQEQALFHQINSDIGAKISEMDITITLIENARTAQALDLVRMNQGQLLQNNIRTNVQSLYSLIEQRLNELIAKRSEKIKWARWSILLTILILSAVILITHETTESAIRKALDGIEKDGKVAGKPQTIRIGVRAPVGLPDGEYRVHMLFRAVRDAVPVVANPNAAAPSGVTERTSTASRSAEGTWPFHSSETKNSAVGITTTSTATNSSGANSARLGAAVHHQ